VELALPAENLQNHQASAAARLRCGVVRVGARSTSMRFTMLSCFSCCGQGNLVSEEACVEWEPAYLKDAHFTQGRLADLLVFVRLLELLDCHNLRGGRLVMQRMPEAAGRSGWRDNLRWAGRDVGRAGTRMQLGCWRVGDAKPVQSPCGVPSARFRKSWGAGSEYTRGATANVQGAGWHPSPIVPNVS